MFHHFPSWTKIALVCLASMTLVSVSIAQEQKIRTKLKGKVKSVAEDRLNVIDAKDMTEIVLQINGRGRGSDLDVVGTATPEYLTPGVAVHLFVELTKAAVAPDPVKEITVCNIDETNNSPICIPADPTKRSNTEPGATNLMEVRGIIKTNRAGKMTIDVPSKRAKKPTLVKISLAPDAKILAHFDDLSMVQEGDEVDMASGVERDPVLIIPRKLKVTMVNPLTPSEKKGPGSKRTTAKTGK